jgi:uncharacterized protein YyaL (SSP411 family)
LNELLERTRRALFAAREKRIKPARDEKILTAWNGLMLAAFAEAGAVFGDDGYLQIARGNADFIWSELHENGRLLRTWKAGQAKLNGYIEDYANVADGLIELYQATGEPQYLLNARLLADRMITEFWDEENGGFFFTSNDHEELVVRNKDLFDNATPSGNSVAADVLLKLAKFFGEDKYERFAVTVLRLCASQIRRYPQGFGRALSALDLHLSRIKEIVVIGPENNELANAVRSRYSPNAIVAVSDDPEAMSKDIPIFEDKALIDGNAAAYVCENFVCQRPVTQVAELVVEMAS